MTAYEHFKAAIAKRDRILDGKINETLIMAWADVARECAKSNDAFRREIGDKVHSRSEQVFFNNLDKVWWHARAQVETLARVAT